MTAAALSPKWFPHQVGFAEIISAMLSKIMKIVRYIRPTKRWTKAQQERATDRKGIHFTIVEGEDKRTFVNALKQLKPDRALLIENLQVFARRRDTICERIRAVFAIGASIMLANGKIYTPDQEEPLIEGVMTGGYLIKEPKTREAHNRKSDEVRAKALEFWKQKDLSNAQVARNAKVSYQTMYKWFQAEHPREQKRGRPRKK